VGDKETNGQIFTKDFVDKYLFTAEELQKGIYLPVNVDDINDIDSHNDKLRAYSSLGLTQVPKD